MTDISEEAIKVGKAIYRKALHVRRGFRPDQVGIPDDDDIWQEIYEDIGRNAIKAAAPFIIAAERERCAKHIAWLDDMPGDALIAMHDHIHTIMDERSGGKISDARKKKAKAIRSGE